MVWETDMHSNALFPGQEPNNKRLCLYTTTRIYISHKVSKIIRTLSSVWNVSESSERRGKKQYHHKANVAIKTVTKQFRLKQDNKVDVKCKRKQKKKL